MHPRSILNMTADVVALDWDVVMSSCTNFAQKRIAEDLRKNIGDAFDENAIRIARQRDGKKWIENYEVSQYGHLLDTFVPGNTIGLLDNMHGEHKYAC